MWPFTRRVTVVHTGLEPLSEAIRYAAEVKAGMHRPEEPAPPPKPPEPTHRMDGTFSLWVSSQGFSEAQTSHLKACWDIVTAKREPPSGFTREACRLVLVDAGAPLPVA